MHGLTAGEPLPHACQVDMVLHASLLSAVTCTSCCLATCVCLYTVTQSRAVLRLGCPAEPVAPATPTRPPTPARYFWSAAPGSIKRQKILNELLPGPLIGRSVTIVTANDPQAPPSGHRRLLQLGALVGGLTSTLGLPGSGVAPLLSGVANTAASLLNAGSYSKSYDAANTCSLAYPLVQPTKGASTVFIYHPQAVGQFRKRVLGRWFVETQARGRYNEDTFAAECDRKGVADLGATLAYLSPANCITITTGQYNRA